MINQSLSKGFITLVQEARLNDFSKAILESKYNVICSKSGTTQGGGLASFFPFDIQKSTWEVVEIPNHLLAAVVDLPSGQRLVVVNIYGVPDSSRLRKLEFITKVEAELIRLKQKYPLAHIVGRGDANLDLDKLESETCIQFREMLQKIECIDVFRFLYPSVKTHPGHTRHPFKGQKKFPRRLDLVICPEFLALNNKIKWNRCFLTSDHMVISAKFLSKIVPINHGKKRLQFLQYQMENENHKNQFKECILACMDEKNLKNGYLT